MTKRVERLIRYLSVAILTLAVATAAFSQEAEPWDPNKSPLPPPTGPVNDYAGVIDEATKQRLNQRLTEFQRKTGNELAVAVVKTTGDHDIFDYSLAVARGWGVGSKGDDNPSALLLIAIDDRKYFTQVSRDLEDELPDGLVGSLQRQYLVPEFKKGDYAKGISDTTEAYISTIEQRSSGTAASPTPVGGRERVSTSQGLYSTFCCLVAIGFILLIIWGSRRGGGGGKSGGDRDRWGGGGFGGGASALPWIIGSAIASSGGSSSSSDWGSSSSGGSDWGGFGGGGDFGGGGAGGGW
jgi:uncharacterized protein